MRRIEAAGAAGPQGSNHEDGKKDHSPLKEYTMTFTSLFILAGLLSGRTAPLPSGPAADPPKIVTSLTTYGAIAREIVGDKGTITSIAQGDEDPHFVQPKPSFVSILRNADLFVTTGMDLELWVPALLDRAGNRKIMDGG